MSKSERHVARIDTRRGDDSCGNIAISVRSTDRAWGSRDETRKTKIIRDLKEEKKTIATKADDKSTRL